jgi:hypothetical protein
MDARETTGDEGVVLEYHRPPTSPRPQPLVPLLLSLPALLSWLLLGAFVFRRQIPRPMIFPFFFAMRLGVLVWATAIALGMFSVAYYWRKPKRWYVAACLLLNGSVLLATAGIVGFLLYAQWQFG